VRELGMDSRLGLTLFLTAFCFNATWAFPVYICIMHVAGSAVLTSTALRLLKSYASIPSESI
jgi:hypothetical protein